MIVGAAVVEIHVHGSQSLKQKRGVVRSITQRVRNRFNLAVSEVGGQDTWQRAVLGLAGTGSDPQRVRGVLDRAIAFIEDLHLAELRAADVEIITLPLEMDDGAWYAEDSDESAEGIGGGGEMAEALHDSEPED
jgi:uncharacterized protein YlxP (DUF503 family)